MAEETLSLFEQCSKDLDPTDPTNLAGIVECIAVEQEAVSFCHFGRTLRRVVDRRAKRIFGFSPHVCIFLVMYQSTGTLCSH